MATPLSARAAEGGLSFPRGPPLESTAAQTRRGARSARPDTGSTSGGGGAGILLLRPVQHLAMGTRFGQGAARGWPLRSCRRKLHAHPQGQSRTMQSSSLAAASLRLRSLACAAFFGAEDTAAYAAAADACGPLPDCNKLGNLAAGGAAALGAATSAFCACRFADFRRSRAVLGCDAFGRGGTVASARDILVTGGNCEGKGYNICIGICGTWNAEHMCSCEGCTCGVICTCHCGGVDGAACCCRCICKAAVGPVHATADDASDSHPQKPTLRTCAM
mmetsp:Transcript_19208/g.54770  ORF Transcript_19208/g.54770 Transcript_19208/m.54770 type:complete len:276 (+) Transcript_19208:118-945(+)